MDSPVNNSCHKHEQQSTRRAKLIIMKNVFILCTAWLLMFTSWFSIQNIQSSINMEANLGVISLAVVYVGVLSSSFFLPSLLIARIGCKWTMSVVLIGYITYFICNFWQTWASLITGSALIGFCGGFLWSAKCAYLTQMGVNYALLSQEKPQAVIGRFFGIFFAFYQCCQFCGNILSSLILVPDSPNATTSAVQFHNLSDFAINISATCGMSFCSGSLNVNSTVPSSIKIEILIGVYVALAVTSFLLLTIFLDSVEIDTNDRLDNIQGPLRNSLRQILRPRQLLLIPITIYVGLQQSYVAAEYTSAFITCNFGVWMVGYIMMCYGITGGISAFLSGILMAKVNRLSVMSFGFAIQICALILVIFSDKLAFSPAFYFIVAAIWGVGEIWQTSVNSIYGCIFPEETKEAFTNLNLFRSVGFIFGFAYSGELCIVSKTYICLGFCCFAFICYLGVEFLQKHQTPPSSDVIKIPLAYSWENIRDIKRKRHKTQDTAALELVSPESNVNDIICTNGSENNHFIEHENLVLS